MSVLYVTEPDEETGMVAAITDEPCPCGWPETVLHIMPDGATTRGCPSCETETQESSDPVHPPMPVGHMRVCGCPECIAWLEAHEPEGRES